MLDHLPLGSRHEWSGRAGRWPGWCIKKFKVRCKIPSITSNAHVQRVQNFSRSNHPHSHEANMVILQVQSSFLIRPRRKVGHYVVSVASHHEAEPAVFDRGLMSA